MNLYDVLLLLLCSTFKLVAIVICILRIYEMLMIWLSGVIISWHKLAVNFCENCAYMMLRSFWITRVISVTIKIYLACPLTVHVLISIMTIFSVVSVSAYSSLFSSTMPLA